MERNAVVEIRRAAGMQQNQPWHRHLDVLRRCRQETAARRDVLSTSSSEFSRPLRSVPGPCGIDGLAGSADASPTSHSLYSRCGACQRARHWWQRCDYNRRPVWDWVQRNESARRGHSGNKNPLGFGFFMHCHGGCRYFCFARVSFFRAISGQKLIGCAPQEEERGSRL